MCIRDSVKTHSQDSTEQPDSRISATITGWKIAWHVSDLMSDRFQELQSNPTRESWYACTHGFLQELQARSKGCYSHYSVKLMLDGVLTTQPQLHKVLSWWPMLCTAYKTELPLMYANIERNEDQLFLAAVHWHNQLKKISKDWNSTNHSRNYVGLSAVWHREFNSCKTPSALYSPTCNVAEHLNLTSIEHS